MTPLLTLQDLAVDQEGRRVLDAPEVRVNQGETLAVLGPTGAGKSTLLRVMNGLMPVSRGRVLWDGRPLPWPMPLATRRRMAMAFQDPLLFRGSVFDNVAYGLRLRGMPRRQVRERVEEILTSFSVGHLSERSSARLSGGEAHRVSLARALVITPELLLLDEPLASVDLVTRDRLVGELRSILRQRGLTCVYVTHDQTEAQRIADRIMVLEAGQVLQQGTAEQIFYYPKDERVARFVQTRNMIPGIVERSIDGSVRLRVRDLTIEAISDLPEGSAVWICIRPEEIVVAKPAESCAPADRTGHPNRVVVDSARNRLRGAIAALHTLGPLTYVSIDCGMSLEAIVTRLSAKELGLCVGDMVEASFKATALHVLKQSEVI